MQETWKISHVFWRPFLPLIALNLIEILSQTTSIDSMITKDLNR